MRHRAAIALTVGLVISSLAAPDAAAQTREPFRLKGGFAQGGLVTGWAPRGSTVTLDGEAIRPNARGWFALGFGRDHGPTAELVVTTPDGRRHARTLQIRQRQYREQRIDGLPRTFIDPESRLYKRLEREYLMIKHARETRTAAAFFRQGLIWPVRGRITGVYGSRRILNGKPQRPHFGVDIAAVRGTPVRAAAAGSVLVAYDQMHFAGRTVLIDHGLGVNTVYIHLHTIAVRKGQKVDRGDVIGTIGTTGRSTGPHLHWGLNLHQLPLDPALAVKQGGALDIGPRNRSLPRNLPDRPRPFGPRQQGRR